MKRTKLRSILLLWPVLPFGVPSLDAVQEEIKAGHYVRAEQLMQEVVATQPKSAQAHYAYAEILAHNGHYEQAELQVREAHALDPQLTFIDPDKFARFERLLQQEQRARRMAGASGSPPQRGTPEDGVGWLWITGIVVVAFIVWRLAARRWNGTSR